MRDLPGQESSGLSPRSVDERYHSEVEFGWVNEDLVECSVLSLLALRFVLKAGCTSNEIQDR